MEVFGLKKSFDVYLLIATKRMKIIRTGHRGSIITSKRVLQPAQVVCGK